MFLRRKRGQKKSKKCFKKWGGGSGEEREGKDKVFNLQTPRWGRGGVVWVACVGDHRRGWGWGALSGGGPWGPPWRPACPSAPRSSPLSPRLEINRFVSQRPGDTEGRRQEQAGLGGWGEAVRRYGGDPHLVSALRKEGGGGAGVDLTSTHSGQKSFKVLSQRRIETSEGRKTEAHRSPPGPWPGPQTPCRGAPGGRGAQNPCVPQKAQTKPRNPSTGRAGGEPEGARVPVEGENITEEKNLRKALP